MGRFHGAAAAGCAGAAGYALQIEGDEEGFAFYSGEKKIAGVRGARNFGRCASAGDAIDADLRDLGEQALFEFVAECGDALRVLLPARAG